MYPKECLVDWIIKSFVVPNGAKNFLLRAWWFYPFLVHSEMNAFVNLVLAADSLAPTDLLRQSGVEECILHRAAPPKSIPTVAPSTRDAVLQWGQS